MRTLCTQFIRSRMLNRLVAIAGVLTTLSLLLYYLLFLSTLIMGAAGVLLANALADLTSMVFVFFAGWCWRYFKPIVFDKALWKEMLRYCLPMIFIGMNYTDYEAYTFKFTKDAEMEIDSDLRTGVLQKISKGVKSRKR